MDNPTSTPITNQGAPSSSTDQKGSAPAANPTSNSPYSATEQKNSSQQSNAAPKDIGGDQKNESKNDIVKENKDVIAG